LIDNTDENHNTLFCLKVLFHVAPDFEINVPKCWMPHIKAKINQ